MERTLITAADADCILRFSPRFKVTTFLYENRQSRTSSKSEKKLGKRSLEKAKATSQSISL
jgi:hypothetical protein